jgi:hypothetical protein
MPVFYTVTIVLTNNLQSPIIGTKIKNMQYFNKLPGFSGTQSITKIVANPGTEYLKFPTLMTIKIPDNLKLTFKLLSLDPFCPKLFIFFISKYCLNKLSSSTESVKNTN